MNLTPDRATMHLCWHELGSVVEELDKLGRAGNKQAAAISDKIGTIRSRLFIKGPHNTSVIDTRSDDENEIMEQFKRIDALLVKRLERAMKKDRVIALAAALSKGFEKDKWGDIDPWSFRTLAKEKPEEWGESEKSLHKILKKALTTV